MDPPLCIGITLTIFISLGNTPVENDLLIIYASGIIIKSGIKVNNLNGILEGPVDLFPRALIIEELNEYLPSMKFDSYYDDNLLQPEVGKILHYNSISLFKRPLPQPGRRY